MLDVTQASATTIARAVRDRRISAVDAVEACLERIAAVNPRINAVVALDPGSIARAEEADARLKAGDSVGPLHGVPFTAKDSLDTAGVVTTAGTIGWRERVPERDATVVARLKAAGAILIGKTNTPEFTWSDETDNDVYGRSNNPYDLERTPGGSSGGPAAIVAAGGVPFDIGSDSADSIRQPAHVCGIAGLKPTSGRVPRTGHWPGFEGLIQSFTQLGPMARRVEDLHPILAVIAGPDGVDPHIAPAPLRDPADVTVGSLRVVAFTDNGILPPTDDTVTAVEVGIKAIEATGARIRRERPPHLREAWQALDAMIAADGHAWLQRLITSAGTPGFGSYDTRGWVKRRPPLSGEAFSALVERIDRVRGQLLAWMDEVDLIVCPVMPQPAIRHGESNADWFGDTYSDVHNLTGWPSAVVRAGSTAGGLPIGVQLVAAPWREDVAIAAAAVVEAATGGWQPPPL